jgi:CheY-like chemotaxis protein
MDFIIATSEKNKSTLARCVEAGCDDFVLKPFSYPFHFQVIVRWASSFVRMTARPGRGVEFLTGTKGEREII